MDIRAGIATSRYGDRCGKDSHCQSKWPIFEGTGRPPGITQFKAALFGLFESHCFHRDDKTLYQRSLPEGKIALLTGQRPPGLVRDNQLKTIVIADDHELFLEGLAILLGRLRFDVVASVRDGFAAVEAIAANQPRFAILDGSMPGLGGVGVISEVKSREISPRTRFLLLTMFNHGHLAADARAAGAGGVVSKDDTSRELEEALRSLDSAEENGFYLSTSMRADAEAYLSGEMATLTPREREILDAVVRGGTTKEIAHDLGLSARTVDHHRERLMRKIGAKNTADVVRFAARSGLPLE